MTKPFEVKSKLTFEVKSSALSTPTPFEVGLPRKRTMDMDMDMDRSWSAEPEAIRAMPLAEEGGHVETARILKEHTSDALESLNLSRCCATCGSRTALKVCAGDGCRAKYCSTACQREGWKRRGHKRSCGNALPTKDSIACAAPGSLVASLEEFGPASSKLTLACLDRIDTFASDDSGPLARLQEAADCVASLCACLTAHTADALVQEKARLATPIHTFQKNRPPQHSTPFPFQLQGLFALTKIRMVVRVGTSNLARLEAGHLVRIS